MSVHACPPCELYSTPGVLTASRVNLLRDASSAFDLIQAGFSTHVFALSPCSAIRIYLDHISLPCPRSAYSRPSPAQLDAVTPATSCFLHKTSPRSSPRGAHLGHLHADPRPLSHLVRTAGFASYKYGSAAASWSLFSSYYHHHTTTCTTAYAATTITLGTAPPRHSSARRRAR